MKLITLTGLLMCLGFLSNAQDSGDQMFDNTILHEIRFEFDQP